MKSNIFPSNFRPIFPALVAMFAISVTFSLYNFALFQNVIDMEWSNSFVTSTYNVCFTSCILGFIGLLLHPMTALNKKVMLGITVLVYLASILLFHQSNLKGAWVLFFFIQGGTSVFWHQNVRLTLIKNAHKNEYARMFALYTISHIVGNVAGGFLFKIMENQEQVLHALLGCYTIGIISLLFYPKGDTNQPHKGHEPITLHRILTLLRINPAIWIVALGAGFMGETFFNFYVPYLNQNNVISTTALSALLGFQIGGVLFKYPTATLMDKLGLLRTTAGIIAASVIMNVVFAIQVGENAFYIITFGVILGGFLNALTIVGDTAITMAFPKREHQTVTTLAILIYFLGGLIGNSLVGPSMDQLGSVYFPIITIIFIGLMLAGMILNKSLLSAKY